MAFEDDMIAAGATKIIKKRYFVTPGDDGEMAEADIETISFIDCNGNPTRPHVWVPPGKEYRCYNEDNETTIKRKIKNKEAPELVATEVKTK